MLGQTETGTPAEQQIVNQHRLTAVVLHSITPRRQWTIENSIAVPAAGHHEAAPHHGGADDHARKERQDCPHVRTIPRLRFAWRCSGCHRILMRHHMPLAVIAGLVGPLEVKCHCNHVNRL